MTWALWLAAPALATAVSALACWWHGRDERPRRRRPDTAAAMRAHGSYLQALRAAPRGRQRVGG
ncbi:MAG: hypothetical protein EPN43_08905 [Jatrophihabitans sp.]|nr:MAG: hypothetical protein EPN43_08905 [Jatrophihabitans sp.]